MADKSQPGKIIVKNYPSDTTAVDLQIMFEKYGKIQDMFTPTDKVTHKPRNFTFIRYRRPEDADDAVRGMNGRDIDGFRIIVEYASPRTGPGGGGGRGGARDGERGGVRGIGMKRGRDGWEDARGGRRRSPSPRGDRRSPIMRDSWRGGERDRDMLGQAEEDYEGHWMHGMPPPPGMNEPPPYWQGGGGGMPPPPGSGGPPRPGRKTLLNTPPVPPIYSGSVEGSQGPSHRPTYGGYHGEKGYGDSPDGGYGPPMSAPSRGDHYSGPPPRDGFGVPPPSRGGWGAESSSGPPPPRGPPPQESYGNPPPSRGGSGYYSDDPYSSKPPPAHHSYQEPPSNSTGYRSSQRNSGYQYHDEYHGGGGGVSGSARMYDDYSAPPSHTQEPSYLPQGSGYSSSAPGSDYRSSSYGSAPRPGTSTLPPPSSYESRGYRTGYGGGRQTESSYDYGRQRSSVGGQGSESGSSFPQGPPLSGYGGSGSGRQQAPTQRGTPPSASYGRGSSGSDSYSRGPPPSSGNPPPSFAGKGSSGDRYYGSTAPIPRGGGSNYPSGGSYSQEPVRGGYGSNPSPSSYDTMPPSSSYQQGGGYRGESGSFSGSSPQPKYSQSTIPTGYGPPSGQSQRSGGPGSRGTTSTGYLPSQGYTKPGPQY